jgi:hypothetical protein
VIDGISFNNKPVEGLDEMIAKAHDFAYFFLLCNRDIRDKIIVNYNIDSITTYIFTKRSTKIEEIDQDFVVKVIYSYTKISELLYRERDNSTLLFDKIFGNSYSEDENYYVKKWWNCNGRTKSLTFLWNMLVYHDQYLFLKFVARFIERESRPGGELA